MSLEWATYGPGATIYCPGHYRAGWFTNGLGHPRHTSRHGPCRQRWGRVGPDTMIRLRLRRAGALLAPGLTLILECPECGHPIEFVTYAHG